MPSMPGSGTVPPLVLVLVVVPRELVLEVVVVVVPRELELELELVLVVVPPELELELELPPQRVLPVEWPQLQ